MLFGSWADGFRKRPNELPLFDPEISRMAGGDLTIEQALGGGVEVRLRVPAAPPESLKAQVNNL